MNGQPVVTCIVPTYNGSTWIEECLNSILAQTYPWIQTVVCDDGSTDDTRELIRSKFGTRITLLEQSNGGVASARNAAIRAADGDFIAFVDQDDRWLPTKLERQVDLLQQKDEWAGLYCDAEEFCETGERVRFSKLHPGTTDTENLAKAIIECQVPLVSTFLFRREAFFNDSVWFSEEASGVDDVGLLLEMLGHGYQIGYLDWVGTERRMHDQNQSSDHVRRFERRILLYEALLSRCHYFDIEMRQLVRAGLADAAYQVGEWRLGNNQRSEARSAFLMAASNRKTHLPYAFWFAISSLPGPLVGFLRQIKNALSFRN